MQQLSLNMSDRNGEGINEQFFNAAELQSRRWHRQQLCKQAGEWSSFATLGKSIGSLCTVAAGESINNAPQGFQAAGMFPPKTTFKASESQHFLLFGLWI